MFDRFLQKEVRHEIPFELHLDELLEALEPADVILTSGNRKLGKIIQHITRSPWSHAAMYVGNGKLIEADDISYQNGRFVREEKRVRYNPIDKYLQHHIRIKRPVLLEQPQRVIDFVKAHEGMPYDNTSIARLVFQQLGFRNYDSKHNLGGCKEQTCNTVHCSGLLARVFQEVDYPINPTVISIKDGKAVYGKRHSSQIVPADFDFAGQAWFETIPFHKHLPCEFRE